jgi:hypothetical protein
MLVQELHIELDLVLKRINSNSFKRILPEEKDWYLNMAALSYVQGRRNIETDVKKLGYQETRKRLEDLEFLISNTTLYPKRETDNVQYVVLPHDFCASSVELINTSYNCGGVTKVTTNQTEYVAVVPFNTTTRPVGHYAVPRMSLITIAGSTLVGSIGQYNATISDIDLRYDAINFLKELSIACKDSTNTSLNKLRVYWEKYDNNVYPESLIFVTTDVTIATTMQIRFTYGVSINVDYAFSTQLTKPIISSTTTPLVTTTDTGRLTKSEDIHNLQGFSFGKSKYDDVLCTMKRKCLYLYTDNKFIVNYVDYEYLRKPKIVNINIGKQIDQEFTEQQCHEIIGLAAKLISRYAGMPTSEKIAASVIELE